MSKKVAVVLSGCGVFDGSEIYEASVTLLHLAKQGVAWQCLAPKATFDEIDHVAQKPTGHKRDVLVESARLARGDIQALDDVNAEDFAAIIFPGGFGAAKNLCNFATADSVENIACLPSVEKFVQAAHGQKIPLGFICIAPAMASAALKGKGIKLTIGNDAGTAQRLEALGNTHVNCAVDDIVVDTAHNVVSTPAFMLAKHIGELDEGIGRLVYEVCARAQNIAKL